MQMRNMIWPWRRKSRRRMARIVIDGPITGATRKRVLKALREVKQREFPALLLRIAVSYTHLTLPTICSV